MTSEEAINHIRDIISENNSIKPSMAVFELEKEALRIAIKALEQEPILDKIRAEIEESRWIDKDTRIVRNALASGLEKALEIIDKYKAESE